ncbi:asparagine synthase (glutamine-hydrolyzing) [Longimicrobium sp.]|uniref:asparagine synthase (glutamine-hydrolyzing) n=1 Tax=Longimicrobium sp. TaxID=2029185 RepID=UPI002B977D79|nr:asparagine synthase (glutamine-hydrolyzing) [Longimicrobium sp.]HSU17091.1 asparagine synthase (glutamine-hydrolyzing) [Longimicrobium sp.]
MCGICGRVGRPEPARLRASTEALEHRGPDQLGEWCGPAAMLGHRRLSVIDLSDDARQPMANEDGTVRVVFNGEIYNFQELRRQLEGRHRFRSHSDTEVVVHGYEEWGIEGLLRRASGMFALALWDDARGVLHLARDRVGKKPLYYAEDGGGLAFASTLPALLELLPAAPEVRPGAVRDFLHYLCVPGEGSFVEGVRKLPPAHRAEFRGGTLSIHSYWSLSFARQERRSEEEWLGAIDGEVRAAVGRRLVADVPIGAFLSGGVDSSLVAGVMAELSPGKVTTISAGFEEAGFSELEHARRVARHLGTDHHEHMVRADAAAVLPWLVYAAGEPFGDAATLPTMYLSQAAREHVTVALTGDGGDELFAGYPGPLLARAASTYMRVVPSALRRGALPGALRAAERAGGAAARAARRLRRLAEPARGARLEWVFDPLAERGFRGRLDGLLEPDFARRLPAGDADAHWLDAFARADGPTDADRVLAAEIATVLPDLMLAKADVASMAYGLELRSPLLDPALMELAARIPAGVKLAGWEPKHLLKRLAARYVPREGIYRRKQGFAVPVGAWLRGPLGRAAAGVLLDDAAASRGFFRPDAVRALLDAHRSGREEHGSRIWLLLLLELWMRIFIDRTLSPHDRLDVPARASGVQVAVAGMGGRAG